ncbi:MAG: hypothetical protein ABIC57_03135 [bacterium]
MPKLIFLSDLFYLTGKIVFVPENQFFEFGKKQCKINHEKRKTAEKEKKNKKK